jgi:glycosyltransferase involved in cell wall biosynthesis
MAETTPLVSVLMPVYNGERYVKAAVESILAQTFTDFELLIVDDGSNEATKTILREAAARDARIRLEERERAGYVSALTTMLALARGVLIARMDADDIAHPGRLRQQVEFLEQHPEVVCVGSAFDIIDEHGDRLTRLSPSTSDEEIQQLLLSGHTAICHPSAMMRTAAVRAAGGYDESVTSVEDLDLFLKLGELGQLANLPRALVRYRVHESSVSAKAGLRQRALGHEVCCRAWDRRMLPESERNYTAGESWRPGEDRRSRHDYAIRYGWWAFNSGQWRAALRYGSRAVTLQPWAVGGWKLLASAAFKPRPWPTPAPVVSEAPATPLVTVLMPMYNAQAFLGEAIESILEQSYADFEFLIIDDGSTDASALLAREYAKGDRRIEIIGRERGGYVAALNYGLNFARGRYIARMDADDICEPERLERQVARMEAEPDLVVLGSCANAIDPHGRMLGAFDVPLRHEDLEAAHLRGESSIHHPSAMIRQEALERVGRYREALAPAEDFDLWLRLGEVGRLENLPERLIRKRLTISGVVGSTLWMQASVVQWALQDAWERRKLPGEPPRPVRSLNTEGDLYRQWGWMALHHRSLGAARLYAARSLLREPLREPSWRLAFCAARGR